MDLLSYVKIPIAFFRSDIFTESRRSNSQAGFSIPEALLWLASRQAFREQKVLRGVNAIILQPGQVCESIRRMSEEFGWSKGKVERFLKKYDGIAFSVKKTERKTDPVVNASNETEIVEQTETAITVITLSNLLASDANDVDDKDRVVSKPKRKTGTGSNKKQVQNQKDIKLQKEQKDHYLLSGGDKINALDCIDDKANCDVWMTNSEFEELSSSLGDAFFYQCYEVTKWIRSKSHLNGRWWKQNHAEIVRRFHRNKLEKGLAFYNHPDLGMGYYPTWQVEKLRREA